MPTLKIGSKAIIKDTQEQLIIENIHYGSYFLAGKPNPYTSGDLLPVKEKPTANKKHKINTHSPLRNILNQIYALIHFQYLKENPCCMAKLHHCSHKATEIHHKYKRDGYYLVMEDLFLPICHSCHDNVTENSEEAIRLGLSISRKQNVPYQFTDRIMVLFTEFGVKTP